MNSLNIGKQIYQLADQLAWFKLYHGDIKPANIMLDKSRNLFLIDIDSFSDDSNRYDCMITKTYSPRNIFIQIFMTLKNKNFLY